jgi:membrane protease YdiL (CAAX protease family)
VALLGPGLLLLSALVPELRPALAAVIAAGWLLLQVLGRQSVGGLAWAAALPVALILAWPSILGVDRPAGAVGCTDPFAVIALRRVLLGASVLLLGAVLVRVHQTGLGVKPLRGIAPWELGLGAGGLAVVAAAGLVVGPALAAPFFGPLEFPRPVAAVAPAVAFGVANGTLEEVAYRGFLQSWVGRLATPAVGLVFQALVFGIVHAGPEVTALLPLHVALLGSAGLLAGLVVRRTGSLAIPIGVHIGADIALYYGLACRAAG